MVLGPRDVQTTLNYHRKMDQPPYYYVNWEPPEGIAGTNASNESHPAIVYDARGKEDTLGLDVSGFEWLKYPSVEKDFVDEERVRTVYYAEVEELLKKHIGAKRVHIFDSIIRRNVEADTEPARTTSRGPAHIVHADHAFEGAEMIVRRRLPDDAERLLQGRYQIVVAWRPIANPVAHYPFAVVDYRTLDVDADLVLSRLIFPKYEGLAFNVKHNPAHKWYYLSDQAPDEVLLMKGFDSDMDKARVVPHSAFPDATSPADAPHRQSIEVRALVFDRE